MKKSVIFSILFVLMLTSLASAKISITEPLEIYSLGDTIHTTVTVEPKSIEGFFEINLVCGEEKLTIERFVANRFAIGQEQVNPTNFPLTPAYIEKLRGECAIVSSIGGEEISTKAFTISDQIKITSSLNKENYDPEETITLIVEVAKDNLHLLNGFLEVSGATDFSKEIVEGLLTETFSMPATTESGDYEINLFIYDRGENKEILNNGNTTLTFKINQIPSHIETSFFEFEATPGEEFTFGLDLYDQSGRNMTSLISSLIISPEGEETQLSTNSGNTTSITFLTNATPGEYRIISTFDEAVDEKIFTVKEIQKVDFDFLGTVLTITNVGNAVYNKTIEIDIGGEIQTLDLNIEIGEQRKFNLKAPDGEYEVIVKDDQETVQRTILLTGRAISVDDLRSVVRYASHPFVWIFIVVALGSLAFIFIFRRKNTFKLKERMGKILPHKSKKLEEDKTENIVDLTKTDTGDAESSLVLKGEKTQSSILALKIKNYSSLGKEALTSLKKTLEIAKENKGMVDQKEDYFLIIFSPISTKTFKNEAQAAKAGRQILESIEEYNKKAVDKIEFGLGLHTGELITSLENKKLKYTSIGNTIILAKKISGESEGKLLASEETRKKLLREVKSEKAKSIGNLKVYEIEKVTDREANKEKLQDILHRMEREEKHDRK
jgi:hypothetical protein